MSCIQPSSYVSPDVTEEKGNVRSIVADARDERLVNASMVPQEDSNFMAVGVMC